MVTVWWKLIYSAISPQKLWSLCTTVSPSRSVCSCTSSIFKGRVRCLVGARTQNPHASTLREAREDHLLVLKESS